MDYLTLIFGWDTSVGILQTLDQSPKYHPHDNIIIKHALPSNPDLD